MNRVAFVSIVGLVLLFGVLNMGLGQPNVPPDVEEARLRKLPLETPKLPTAGRYLVLSPKEFGELCAAESAVDNPRDGSGGALKRKEAALNKLAKDGWDLVATEVTGGTTSSYIFKGR